MNKLLLSLFFIFVATTTFSQIIKINDASNAESSYSLQTLVEDVFISGDCAQIDTFSEQVFGAPNSLTTKSYGFFKRPTGSNFPFDEGIILSTGRAYEGGNTTNGALVSSDLSLSGDADLEAALGTAGTNDATFIKFNFQTVTSNISFRFLMASEEYGGNTECAYADAFAFLLRRAGTTNYTNIAILPDGSVVNVRNINNSTNCPAHESDFAGYNLPDTNYGGRTKILTASATVVPGQLYEMKIVVVDQNDEIWDSAIFLEAGSFDLGANLGDPNLSGNNSAVCGTEKLLDANIIAQTPSSYEWFFDNEPIDGNFVTITGENFQTYNANLGNGVYKVRATIDVGCVGEDEIELQFVTAASINNSITNLYQCDNDADGVATFNLTEKQNEILNGQLATEFEVLYYTDNTYTTEVADATAYDSAGETIYTQVRNIASTNCTAQSSFVIEISNTDMADTNDIPAISYCDNDTVGNYFDGYIKFDLTENKLDILNGASENNYTLTYFTEDTYTDQITVPTAYTNIETPQTIYVQMTNNLDVNCYDRASFKIEVYKIPEINSLIEFQQCDEDTDSTNNTLVDLTQANSFVSDNYNDESFVYYSSFYNAENELSPIATPQNFEVTDGDIFWVRVKNQNECYTIGQVNVAVTISNAVFNKTIINCDDFIEGVSTEYDGLSEFNLIQVNDEVLALFPLGIRSKLNITFYPSIEDAQLQNNLITNPHKYRNLNTNTTTANPERIYIRVENENNLNCAGMGLDLYIDLVVNETPYFEIENQIICVDALPYEVSVTNYPAPASGVPDTYQWQDELGNVLNTDPNFSKTAFIERAGEHTVIATSSEGCIKEKTFTVQLSSSAIIKTLTVFDDTVKNKITLVVEGSGEYEYAIDSDNFEDANQLDGHIFYEVEEGLHTIYIKDKNNVGCQIIEREVAILKFPKILTPNQDGINDTFKILGGDDLLVLNVTIFDRYGKIIKVLNNNESWDGTYFGTLLEKTDYWFLVKFTDIRGEKYERKGHFSLKY